MKRGTANGVSRRPTVALVTLGCPKNQVDSEVMLGQLAREGSTSSTTAHRRRDHREHLRVYRHGEGRVDQHDH
jgi:hypothetical protein